MYHYVKYYIEEARKRLNTRQKSVQKHSDPAYLKLLAQSRVVYKRRVRKQYLPCFINGSIWTDWYIKSEGYVFIF